MYDNDQEKIENTEDSAFGDFLQPADDTTAPAEHESPFLFGGFHEPEASEEPANTADFDVSGQENAEDAQAFSQEEAEPQSQPAPHYEPWREPIYREASDVSGNTYSPGHHARNGSDYEYPQYSAPEPKKEKKVREPRAKLGFGRTLCLVLVCVILCSAGSGVVSYLVAENVTKNVQRNQVILGAQGAGDNYAQTSSSPSPVTITGNTLTGTDIYDLGCQQVVGITTSVTRTNFFGQETTSAVSGSGFIISDSGYILTNYHVIEYASSYGYPITVMLHDGSSYSATIVGHEQSSDVAVIKIDATGLSPITFGDSETMKVGEPVYAIGNPLGELAYTMTTGHISALDRVISTEISKSVNMFQFDASVNSGNSGGPVYNSKGEVIGIVTAKYSQSGVEGIGFAIPINDAKAIAADLIENGYVTNRAFLGITPDDVPVNAQEYFNIPEGAYVRSVENASCAETAGIQQGDVITKIDDNSISSAEELRTALRRRRSGDSATLTIYRNGQYIELPVVFDEAPQETSGSGSQQQQQQGGNFYPGYGYNFGY